MENKSPICCELKEISDVVEIARYFGFKPVTSPALTKSDFDLVKNFDQSNNPAELASIFRAYFEDKMHIQTQPVMFCLNRPFPGGKEKKKSLRFEAALVSLGSSRAVCECLSIQTAVSMLSGMGYKNLEVKINSVGDKESTNEFQRKMSAFIRKNINSFPADLRAAIKKDTSCLLREEKSEWQSWIKECPKPLDFLSESSRLHFKEVLEFLEIINIPYSIDYRLIGDLDFGSETVYKISDVDKGEVLASGFRFNRLAKKIGFKKELFSTVLNISARLKKNLKKNKPRNLKPKFYLVQFGQEAKLKSFLVLKEMYKAKANLMHAIAKDKLSSQMGIAENSGAQYIMLLGQKEALDNSVVVRHIATRAQEIVPIPEIGSYIKSIS